MGGDKLLGLATWDIPQAHCFQELASETGLSVGLRREISQLTAELITETRKLKRGDGPVGSLLLEFNLSSAEGRALLSVAEAILRVPDAETADLLIAGKLTGQEWSKHMGLHHNWFANTTAVALVLTDSIIKPQDAPATESVFRNLVRRTGEPVVRKAVRAAVEMLGSQFVFAQDIDAAVKQASDDLCSFDMLGEGAKTMADAKRYLVSYTNAIATVAANPSSRGNHGISIKLSALHPRFESTQAGRVMDELLPEILELTRQAAQADLLLTIDAEELARYDLTMEFLDCLAADTVTKDWAGLGCAVQAYSKRAREAVRTVHDIATRHGRRMHSRLVKGAYWDTEIKLAQEQGLADYPVYTVKSYTDTSYLACARYLLDARDRLFPCFATHNAHTAAAVVRMADGTGGWEFQRLHGMGVGLHATLAKLHGTSSRNYAPVGGHRDLLAYLVRRLLENGANTSFISKLRNSTIPLQELTADPLAEIGGESSLPVPGGYVPGRKVALGLDLNRADHRARLLKAVVRHSPEDCVARAGDGLPTIKEAKIHNPGTGKIVGSCHAASSAAAPLAMDKACHAQPDWNRQPTARRAEILLVAADAMEEATERLTALVTLEGGRQLIDSVAEVREAVDFLRYYATTAPSVFAARKLPGPTGETNSIQLEGKGTFLCISPWNFPLAIFTGQVAAALVAGNAVLAKPAEQTPLCAAAAVRLLHDAGVPAEVLQLLPGDGPKVAKPLLADPRLAGVAFTGGNATAKEIARRLAERDGPVATLIAETGGINAMLVDTSALPEQVTRDVLLSAFRSAGQRCSSLRVLYLMEECADAQQKMIAGAMAELRMGDPADPAVDVGPVIDAQAKKGIDEWIAALPGMPASLLAMTPVPMDLPKGNFVAPQMWLLPGLQSPGKEVFGPVLHVCRFQGKELDNVLTQIATTGHGLTFALHSRCEHRISEVTAKVAAGNVYVNRNQVGALVGTQPFGGFGMSGTGPKAGGPYYLAGFARERTVTRDTTAAGGNVKLLVGE